MPRAKPSDAPRSVARITVCFTPADCSLIRVTWWSRSPPKGTALQNSRDAELETAGRKLDSLRTIRNQADYRLNQRDFADAAFIQLQMRRARAIADAVRVATLSIDAIRPAIRDYAKTAKLPLRP